MISLNLIYVISKFVKIIRPLIVCLYYDGDTLRMVSVPLPTVTLIDMNKLALIIII